MVRADVRPSMQQILLGFLAGILAVLAFHQMMVVVLSAAGMIQGAPYSTRPVPPFNVPTIVNSMFWGGLWGALFAAIAGKLPGRSLWLKGLVFGLLGPLLVNWFVVSPQGGGQLRQAWCRACSPASSS